MRDFVWDSSVAELLFELSGEALLVVDREGHLLHVNPAGQALIVSKGDWHGTLFEAALGTVPGVWQRVLATTPEPVHIALKAGVFSLTCHGVGGAGFVLRILEEENAEAHPLSSSEAGTGIQSELIIRALEYQQMYLAEEKLAHTDALTGIPNRRSFEIALDDRLKQFERHEGIFSLVILDVDHFKKFNDTYGHQTGDEVLQGLARILKSKIRHFDTAYRIGGEEFALILCGSPRDNAVEIADRLRSIVETTRIADLNVTISLGVVTCDQEGWDEISLVKAADEALYHSKESGRNRVTHASHLPDSTQAAS